jgi:hypothetical protein
LLLFSFDNVGMFSGKGHIRSQQLNAFNPFIITCVSAFG